MSWITVLWSMIASACLTLALVHLLVWRKQRDAWGHLLFSVSALATSFMAGCELWMMRAETTAQFGVALRWLHAPAWVVILTLVWFVRLRLGAGRMWLAWTVCGLRTLSLALNFLFAPNLNFREITTLHRIPFLGEFVSVGQGVANPWMMVGQASLLLLTVFIVDASIAVWRRGDWRLALVLGGGMTFFVTLGTAQAILALWELIPMPMTASFFYTGIVIAMGYELSRDVLRAAELARELSESEKRMNLAVQSAGLGLWVRDLERGEVWANEKCRTLFGFPPQGPLTHQDFFERVQPQDRESSQALVQRALAERTTFHTEYRVIPPGGAERWISTTGQAEYDAHGRASRMRGVCADVTARRQADLEAHELRQELAHASRVTMLGQLTTTLAHELNQPLGAILRNAEAAELFLQHDSPDLDEVRAILADIRKDDQRAGGVIDRMRALLRHREVEAEPLEIAALIEDVTAFIRADAIARRVVIETDVPAALPPVHGDAVQLQQVLLNLLLNGMDALNGTNDVRRVAVRARRDGSGAIEIAVSDTGHGIAPEKLGKLFEPFFTTKPQGMGIGLSISRTIIQTHGGNIRAENNADRGATIRITLPVTEEEGAA